MTTLTVPFRVGTASWLVPLRAGLVTGGGLVALAVLVALDLALGDFDVPVGDVVRTLLGGGDPGQRFIVMELRLPRALTGLLVCIALGVSGAITQSVARNALASPDVLGVTAGASAAAVGVIVLSGGAGVLGAAGVPLACDEGSDFRSFRVGLFGLDKLKDVDAAVARFERALNALT